MSALSDAYALRERTLRQNSRREVFRGVAGARGERDVAAGFLH